MADLLRSSTVCCHSHAVVSSSPASTSHASSCMPRGRPLAPFFTNEFVKLTHSIPQAHTQLQDLSSVTPDGGVKWWERNLGAKLGDVHSTQELMNIIENAHGKLVIVEFFASWCGSCRALYPKLCKLAREHQDILFVKVNFEESKAFCKSMNVKVLPFFHLYQGDLKPIDSFSCSIAKLQKLKDAIAKYKDDRLADG